MMSQLFTYTIRIDDGAAPNPFHQMCPLAICKPAIRRVAKRGDWVAGLGSTNAPSGDLSGRLVYAMRVDDVVSMAEYDKQAPGRWPHRVPDVWSKDIEARLGDCVYDFSTGKPMQRTSVHGAEQQKRDLSGRNVLISQHFFYFGRAAINLPDDLLPLRHQTQGHRSNSNAPYFDRFADWIQTAGYVSGKLYGPPDWSIGTPSPLASRIHRRPQNFLAANYLYGERLRENRHRAMAKPFRAIFQIM